MAVVFWDKSQILQMNGSMARNLRIVFGGGDGERGEKRREENDGEGRYVQEAVQGKVREQGEREKRDGFTGRTAGEEESSEGGKSGRKMRRERGETGG